MTIARETADTLVLKDTNWAGIVFGLLFICLGAFFSYSLLAEGTPFDLWFPLVFALVGAFMLIKSKLVTVKIEKSGNSIMVIKKGIGGKQTSQYRIDQLAAIEVRQLYGATNVGTRVPVKKTQYQTVFIFSSGFEVPIDHAHASSSVVGGRLVSGMGKERLIAEKTAFFLGVPLR